MIYRASFIPSVSQPHTWRFLPSAVAAIFGQIPSISKIKCYEQTQTQTQKIHSTCTQISLHSSTVEMLNIFTTKMTHMVYLEMVEGTYFLNRTQILNNRPCHALSVWPPTSSPTKSGHGSINSNDNPTDLLDPQVLVLEKKTATAISLHFATARPSAPSRNHAMWRPSLRLYPYLQGLMGENRSLMVTGWGDEVKCDLIGIWISFP